MFLDFEQGAFNFNWTQILRNYPIPPKFIIWNNVFQYSSGGKILNKEKHDAKKLMFVMHSCRWTLPYNSNTTISPLFQVHPPPLHPRPWNNKKEDLPEWRNLDNYHALRIYKSIGHKYVWIYRHAQNNINMIFF